MSRRRAAVPALLLAASALVGLGATPAQAAERCYQGTYKNHFTIPTANRSGVVTHAWQKVLSPGSTWSRDTTIERVARVVAGVEYYSEGTVGASGVIAKAEAKVGVRLHAAGEATRRTSITEHVSITNSTGQNREYIVYAGTIKHYGTYVRYYCGSDNVVHTRQGTWRSWTILSDGTIRCDLTAPNAIAKTAKRKYCG